MPQYILRDLDREMWGRARAAADQAGWPMRALIVQLLEDYAAGRLQPSQGPPARAADSETSRHSTT